MGLDSLGLGLGRMITGLGMNLDVLKNFIFLCRLFMGLGFQFFFGVKFEKVGSTALITD
jgi:hypothetical protein